MDNKYAFISAEVIKKIIQGIYPLAKNHIYYFNKLAKKYELFSEIQHNEIRIYAHMQEKLIKYSLIELRDLLYAFVPLALENNIKNLQMTIKYIETDLFMIVGDVKNNCEILEANQKIRNELQEENEILKQELEKIKSEMSAIRNIVN